MGKPYSEDLRNRVVAAVVTGGLPRHRGNSPSLHARGMRQLFHKLRLSNLKSSCFRAFYILPSVARSYPSKQDLGLFCIPPDTRLPLAGHDLCTFQMQHRPGPTMAPSQLLNANCEDSCIHDPRRVRASPSRACRQGGDPHRRKGRNGGERLA